MSEHYVYQQPKYCSSCGLPLIQNSNVVTWNVFTGIAAPNLLCRDGHDAWKKDPYTEEGADSWDLINREFEVHE